MPKRDWSSDVCSSDLVFGGGISVAAVEVNNQDSDRVQPVFTIDRFDNPEAGDPLIASEPNGV